MEQAVTGELSEHSSISFLWNGSTVCIYSKDARAVWQLIKSIKQKISRGKKTAGDFLFFISLFFCRYRHFSDFVGRICVVIYVKLRAENAVYVFKPLLERLIKRGIDNAKVITAFI